MHRYNGLTAGNFPATPENWKPWRGSGAACYITGSNIQKFMEGGTKLWENWKNIRTGIMYWKV